MCIVKRSLTAIFSVLLCNLGVFSPLAAKAKYKHELAVCAIFQNEARFLKEWIEFHKLMGVTRFFLYNNLSTDDYRIVLEPYISSGLVELADWNYPSNTIEEWTSVQTGAYKNGLGKAIQQKVKWLAIIDTDEFLYPVIDANLITFLNKYNDAGGVAVNWQFFGTSFVDEIPPDRLMIEILTKKAPDRYEHNVYIKSIVRPSRVVAMFDPHTVIYKKPYRCVDSEGKTISGGKNESIPIGRARINHYWSRDVKFFNEHKLARRLKWWTGLDKLLKRLDDMNVVDDYTIFRFVDLLKEKIHSEYNH